MSYNGNVCVGMPPNAQSFGRMRSPGDQPFVESQNDAYGAHMLMGLRCREEPNKPKLKNKKVGVVKLAKKLLPSLSSKRKRSGRESAAMGKQCEKKSKKRRRIPISQDQKARLEHVFQYHEHPHRDLKQSLARELNMEPRRVQIWFQNRRAKAKKEREKLKQEADLMQRTYDDPHKRQTYCFNPAQAYQPSFYNTTQQTAPKRHKHKPFYIPSYFTKWRRKHRDRSTYTANAQPRYAQQSMHHPLPHNQFAPPGGFQEQNPGKMLPRLAELDIAYPNFGQPSVAGQQSGVGVPPYQAQQTNYGKGWRGFV